MRTGEARSKLMIYFDVTPDKVPDGAAPMQCRCSEHPGVSGSSGIDHSYSVEREQASPWGTEE